MAHCGRHCNRWHRALRRAQQAERPTVARPRQHTRPISNREQPTHLGAQAAQGLAHEGSDRLGVQRGHLLDLLQQSKSRAGQGAVRAGQMGARRLLMQRFVAWQQQLLGRAAAHGSRNTRQIGCTQSWLIPIERTWLPAQCQPPAAAQGTTANPQQAKQPKQARSNTAAQPTAGGTTQATQTQSCCSHSPPWCGWGRR